MAKPKKPQTPGRILAEVLVDMLMVNGQGYKAERLVLMAKDGRDLGGWGRLPAIDHLAPVIDAAMNAREAGTTAAVKRG
jgi:hypothetical protein